MIFDGTYAFLSRAVGTAIEFLVGLDAVTDDPASTVMTMRCQPLNSTLEAVECESFVVHDYLERQVIIVATNFTTSHDVPLSERYRLLLRESVRF
jgi:hypothetical protein